MRTAAAENLTLTLLHRATDPGMITLPMDIADHDHSEAIFDHLVFC
jgi:hypothetical protein